MPTKNVKFDVKDLLYITNGSLCYEFDTTVTTDTTKICKIEKYEILCPEKVIRVTFTDEKQEKVVCDKVDTFDLRKGLCIAIAKHMYKDKYTLEGIEEKALEVSYTKEYVKMVDKAIREHEKFEKTEKERIEKEKEEKRLAHAKRMERDKKRREHKIEIQKEAYLRAMREFQEEKSEFGE